MVYYVPLLYKAELTILIYFKFFRQFKGKIYTFMNKYCLNELN